MHFIDLLIFLRFSESVIALGCLQQKFQYSKHGLTYALFLRMLFSHRLTILKNDKGDFKVRVLAIFNFIFSFVINNN